MTLKTILLQIAYLRSKQTHDLEEAVATIKSDVKYKLISDHHQCGRKCLDYSPGHKILYSKPTKLYSKFILIHYKNIDDNYCKSNAAQLQNRGQWEITSRTIPHESLCWDYVWNLYFCRDLTYDIPPLTY